MISMLTFLFLVLFLVVCFGASIIITCIIFALVLDLEIYKREVVNDTDKSTVTLLLMGAYTSLLLSAIVNAAIFTTLLVVTGVIM